MRNLKKILALVLALVMSLSLMATAGAGSFQDVTDDNPYKTAIDVLDELKVFQGFEDGTFKPTDTLNRAQAAVLVYRIATGDVEGKYIDNYTYMAQSKFNDLEGYNWAKGYINYCQNAGIVVGTDATHFNPGGQVTGYQLLVMLLRTLGYGKAGEFADPKGWELQTAAIAEREGITKNVTGGDFENPAPRQMVAEILFRGLLTETVQYSALTPGGYTKSGETLGKRELGLEDIKGVVMANEFADLEDDDTLAEGKTRLDVDGKTYNLDVSSELTDIGEIRHAYVQNGTKVLTTLENLNDSTVNQPENGKGAKVSALSKTNGDTQYFLNFGPLVQDESEWRIEYNVEFTTASENGDSAATVMAKFEKDYCKLVADAGMKKVGDYEYTKAIKPGTQITADDLKVIRGIFDLADGGDDPDGNINKGVIGSVYVGANSQSNTNRNKNLAVEMTYKQFVRDYITNENASIKDSDNGEWLKTIDNNGDGVADYVFRTDFIMSTITKYDKIEKDYIVEYDVGKTTKTSTIPEEKIVTEDTLAVGDVILYTWIDDVCYVSHPETEVKAIDKKGIDYKNETITCGDTTYSWSGIDQEADHYYHDVSEAKTGVNYTLYMDHFGYVRLYAEASKGFVLMTDGYYETDRKHDANDVTKAEIYDNAADELAEIDVIDVQAQKGYPYQTWGLFINKNTDSDWSDNRKTWDRLNGFENVYWNCVAWDDKDNDGERDENEDALNWYITNIASYAASDDVYSVDYVQNATDRYDYHTRELDMSSFKKSFKTEALKDTIDGMRVNTTDDTQYYYVVRDVDAKLGRWVVTSVTEWIGRENAPEKLALDGSEVSYAVVSQTYDKDNNNKPATPYEIAEVVVIEADADVTSSVHFMVQLDQRMNGNQQISGYSLPGVKDEETGAWGLAEVSGRVSDQLRTVANRGPLDISDLLRFYEVDSDGNMTWIDTGDFNDNYIFAGTIVTSDKTDYRNYIQISTDGDSWPEYTAKTADIPVFAIDYDHDSALVKDTLLGIFGWSGAQNPVRVGNVKTTFDIDQLDNTWELDDEVIFVTNAKGAVQYIIDVTQSAVKVEGVNTYPGVYDFVDYKGSRGEYDGYTLKTLWNDIAEEQATPTTDLSITATAIKGVDVVDGACELDNTTAKDTAAGALNWKIATTNIDWTQPATLIVSNADSNTAIETVTLTKTNKGVYSSTNHTDFLGAAGITKDKEVTLRFTLVNGGETVMDEVTVTIKKAANDTGVKSVTIKGEPATVKQTDDTTYEVELSKAQAASTTTKELAVVLNDTNATVSSVKITNVKGDSDPSEDITGATVTDSTMDTAKAAFTSGGKLQFTVKAEDNTTKTYTVVVTIDAAPLITLSIAQLQDGKDQLYDGAEVAQNNLPLEDDDTATFTVTVDEGYELVKATGETADVEITLVNEAKNEYEVIVSYDVTPGTDQTINLKLQKVSGSTGDVDDRYESQYAKAGITVNTSADGTEVTITVDETKMLNYLENTGNDELKWIILNKGQTNQAFKWCGYDSNYNNAVVVGVTVPYPEGATNPSLGSVANGAMHKYYGVAAKVDKDDDSTLDTWMGYNDDSRTFSPWEWSYELDGETVSGEITVTVNYVNRVTA